MLWIVQENFCNFILLLEKLLKRENEKIKQMFYFLKDIENILGKFIKKDRGHQL